MKARARRVTMGAAVLMAIIVALLVVANWGTVRDHVEAWHFQLTRETKTIQPQKGMRLRTFGDGGAIVFTRDYLQMLSTTSRLGVICDPAECEEYATLWIQPRGEPPLPTTATPPADWVLNVFRAAGWRIVEQRFPRGAYVVIHTADPQDGYPIVVSDTPRSSGRQCSLHISSSSSCCT